MVERLRPRGREEIVRVAIGLGLGVVAAFLAVPAPRPPAPAAGPTPQVLLDGVALPMGEDEVVSLDAAHAIARAYVARRIAIGVEGDRLERTREELGAVVDAGRLASLVAQARDPRSALRRAHAQIRAQLGGDPPIRLPLPVGVDGDRALEALIGVKDDLDRASRDARYDLGAGRLEADRAGRRVDVYGTLARLDAALSSGAQEVEAVVERVAAARTAAELANVDASDVLGYFETRYAPDRKHEERTYNLRLAASKLDGHVLLPGETFDFNEVVGPRDEANGYKVAPVIAQGELVDGIGGGTCQIAGTLHGAAFFAGLEIVERRPHTRPSFYIKMGMDAAVAYPTITLRLRNPFPFPVVLHETVEGGVVRAEIRGPKRTRDVTFVRKIVDVTPFREREIADASLPRGERVLSQRGIPGFRILRQRIVRDGAFAVRERSTDQYPPTTQIWRVGTGEGSGGAVPSGDEHPEYVADEYLSLSQGPHVVSPRTGAPSSEPGGATVESRVAGRYGTRGWTVRLGFAKAQPASRRR